MRGELRRRARIQGRGRPGNWWWLVYRWVEMGDWVGALHGDGGPWRRLEVVAGRLDGEETEMEAGEDSQRGAAALPLVNGRSLQSGRC